MVNLIAMAKDLELDQHYEIHQNGQACGSDPYDCAVKTRVWHTLFAVELMIGGPQGRMNFAIPLSSIDFEPPITSPGLDEGELQTSRRFAYFMRCIKNVRDTCTVYVASLRTKKLDWAQEPVFLEHNADFDFWLNDLPPYLQISYPPNGSAPWVHDHFIANLHCYHYLTVVMHYRPQLQSTSIGLDDNWRNTMRTSYNAATRICRLQEAVIKTYGLAGLLCMQRGVNFAIYSILTCTMLHLVSMARHPETTTTNSIT